MSALTMQTLIDSMDLLKKALAEPAPQRSPFMEQMFAPVNRSTMYAGLHIRTSAMLTERVQYSRSPSRAKRRAAMGHPQHFAERPRQDALRIGNTLHMHPAMYEQIRIAVPELSDGS